MLIEIKDLKKRYELGKTHVDALRGLNLGIDEGEFLSIVGPSGSGKTTLLNLIGCLDRPTQGSIHFDGVELATLSIKEETLMRRENLGFIFQTFNLIPVLTAWENVEMPLLLNKYTKEERKNMVDEWFLKVGISEFAHHRPDELSGGQRQRVSIARALISNPKVVLADEPTANLDQKTGESIIELMQKMNKEVNTTFVFSTHDPMVTKHARRKVVLTDGMITEDMKR